MSCSEVTNQDFMVIKLMAIEVRTHRDISSKFQFVRTRSSSDRTQYDIEEQYESLQ